MKKSVFFLAFACVLTFGALRAQTPVALPNGSFEQWTSHQGYGVQVLFVNMSVYDAYSTPTDWDYLAYPVNETFSTMGMSININTTIPIVKASVETGQVPDGSTAVKLQTLMISDIINPTVLSLAGNAIDPALAETVIPSILSTGSVNIDSIMPLLSDLMSGTGDITTMLPTLLARDVNDFVTGGLPLNGMKPGLLTGSYKYQSATGGDNGAVVMLGTRYNSVTHKREIVGLGLNLALTDTSAYTPFEVEYLPLGEFIPGAASGTPDSLIVALVSSASDTMQQGSYLCIDNLMLWPAPDTCPNIAGLYASPAIHEATLGWSVSDDTEGFEIEYGLAGFAQGSGTLIPTMATTYTLTNLEANTMYEAYVRSLCSDSVYGQWHSTQFMTASDTCSSVLGLTVENYIYDAFPQYELNWYGSSQPNHWEVEYGLQGFALGTGTVVQTSETYFNIYEIEEAGELLPNTWYDFYVRSVCDDGVYGIRDSVHYLTACAKVTSPTVNADNLQVDANNHIVGYTLSWTDNSGSESWGLYYGIYDSRFPDNWGTYVYVDTTFFEFPPLNANKTYSVEISSHCSTDNFGDIVLVKFTTAGTSGIETGTSNSQTVISIAPNPANGQCTVTPLNGQPAQLKLFSLDGRLLLTLSTDGSPVTLALPSEGIFLLQAITPSGVSTTKIINK